MTNKTKYYIDGESDFTGMDFSAIPDEEDVVLYVSDRSMIPGPLLYKATLASCEFIFVKTLIENALPASICEDIYKYGGVSVIISKNKAYDKEIEHMVSSGISVSRTELAAVSAKKKARSAAKPGSKLPVKTEPADAAKKEETLAKEVKPLKKAETPVKGEGKKSSAKTEKEESPAAVPEKKEKSASPAVCEKLYSEMLAAGIREDIAAKFRGAKAKELEPMMNGALSAGDLESEVTKRIVMLKPVPTNDEAKACLDYFFGKGKYTDKEKSSTYTSVVFSLGIWRNKT